MDKRISQIAKNIIDNSLKLKERETLILQASGVKEVGPPKEDIETKCSICGHVAMQDQYGNGECKNCGWKFSKDEELLEKKVGISYPMLVTPTTAREQYKQSKSFKATFEEFLNGLFFYSEMLFEYDNEIYEVFLKANKNSKSNDDCYIVFCSKNFQQEYTTRKKFENKANINGVLLKDMCDKIEKPSFMYCD